MITSIDRLSDTGEGIGIGSDRKIIFVPKALPGDRVSVKDIKEHKKYMTGNIDKIIDKSPIRCNAECSYFDSCGGCQIMNTSYLEQLKYKKNKVINMFKKYAGIDINPNIVETSQFNYRNKITLKVKDGKVGLYKYHSHEVININKCILVNDSINSVIDIINNNIDLSLVKKIIIKSSNDNKIMIIFIGSVKDIDLLKEYVDSIYINDKLIYGNSKLLTNIGKYSFEVSNDSFFQVNNEEVVRLYDKISEYIPNNSKIMDLYCGTGSIGIYVSEKCKSVLGIEINKNAIEDAIRNKEINNVKNIEFKCGDVEDIISSNDSFDLIIVDPPRAGLSNKTKDILLDISSNSIIYVSCDPMTLVRDIKYLSSKYDLKDVTLFDMFPNTYHVESVCILERR